MILCRSRSLLLLLIGSNMSQQIKKEIVDLTLSDDEEVYIGPKPTLRYEMTEWDGDAIGSNYDTSVDMAMAFDEGTLDDDPQWWVKITDESGKEIKYDYATRNWEGIPSDLKRQKGIVMPQPSVKRALSEPSSLNDEDLFSDEDVAEVKEVKRTKSDKGPRVMRWCCTWNNPTVEGETLAERLKANGQIKGFVFQKEKGENGTPHFQMYLEFSSAVYTNGVKTAIGHTVHCSKANGTKKQNIVYCTKDDDRLDGPWLYGTCLNDKGQGKRSDLDAFADAVMDKGGIDEDIETQYRGLVMRYAKHAQAMINESKYRKAKEDELAYWKEQVAKRKAGEVTEGQKQRKLVLYFGPTAVGKTTNVKETCVEEYDELPFAKDGDTKWWDGYTHEKCVLVDEWRKGFASIEAFNQLTNAGVSRIEHKGSYGTLNAEAMFFTTNKHPLDIFETKWIDARFRAMARRFSKVYWWNDDKELTVLNNPHNMTDDERDGAEAKWIHFWKRDRQQTVVRVEDESRHRDDPLFSLAFANDDEKYFTW